MPKCKPNVEKSKNETEDSNVEKGKIPVRIGKRKKIGYMNRPIKVNEEMHNLPNIFHKMLKFYMTPEIQQPAKPPAIKPLTLFVSNIPTDWTYEEVKQFVEKECGSIQDVELIKPSGDVRIIKIKFFTHTQLVIAKLELVEKEINGRKLTVNDDIIEEGNNMVRPPPRKLYVDAWAEDPQGLYGLRPTFLTSLNITPPISKRVHVFNFKCSKFKLKELLTMAGHVLLFNVKNGIFKCAKVVYSHPLEAVQAISMFNGRTFYGQELGVTMDNVSEEDLRPYGLNNLGPGLGRNGKPVINIAEQFDRLVNQKSSLINTLIFTDVDDIPYAKNVGEANTGQNNQSVPFQNLVFNPFVMKDSTEGIKVGDPRPEMQAPGLPMQNNLPPHAPNLMQVPVKADGLPNIPNVGAVPQNMVQNAIVQFNRPPPPTVMGPNVVQPQAFWNNNEYQVMPPVPMVPNQAIQAPMPERGMIPNMNVAQNLDLRFVSQPPSTVNTANAPYYNTGNVCVTGFPGEVAFQNMSNPMKLAQPEKITGGNNVFHFSRPVIQSTSSEIPTTVVLNNLPTSTLDVLLERLGACGKVMLMQCPYQGCAVVTYATPQQAEQCILMYNGYVTGDGTIHVNYV